MEDKKLILLADASDYYNREFSRILIQDGLEVVTAKDGEQAIRAAQKMDRIDLLIVNLEVPRVLGFEVIKEIRRLKGDPNVPVLALSGSFERSNVDGMLRNLTVVRFFKTSTRPEEILFWVRAILFPKERFSRKSPRIVVDLPIAFWVSDQEFEGQSFTLSEDGVFLRTRFVAHLDSYVRLRFTIPPEHTVDTDSTVIWVNDFKPSKSEAAAPFGMGLRFVSLGAEHRKAIKQFVLDKIIE